jgi:hypothetical protein
MVEAPISIVDDNELHLRTYKSILEGKGHSVMAFETGAAAIEMAKGCKFSLALLDVKLSDILGDELARRLKELDGGVEHNPHHGVSFDAGRHRRSGTGDPGDPGEADRFSGALKGDPGSPDGSTALNHLKDPRVKMGKGKIRRSLNLQSPP